MKILVVSDSHRNFNALKSALDRNPDFDTLIHLGDGESEFEDVSALYPNKGMIYVRGNCDYKQHETVHTARFRGIGIFCCHGHTFGVRSGVELLAAESRKNHCIIALYGHTHVSRIDSVDGVLVMNPGSLSEPRGGDVPSYGIIEIKTDGQFDAKICSLSEEL